LLIVTPSGASIDVSQQNVFRSGAFKGLLDLRDQVLPEAQTQLDELAAGLSRALSDASPAATPVTAGAQNGFAIDLAGIQSGNTTRISFQQGGVTRTVAIVAVDNPSALPLPVGATGNPNDIVIGVSFAGGTAGALADIQSALSAAGTNLTVSNPSGNVLQVVDDGTGVSTVAGVSANITSTLLAGGQGELPLFVDSATGKAYTGSFDAGSQRTGFAGRITINPAVLSNAGALVNYTGTTEAGDATRPNLLLDRLTGATLQFSSDAGLTGAGQSYNGTIGSFLTGIIASQGSNAVQAQNLDAGQQVVVNSLQAKVAQTSGVSIDEELSNLIKMQNAYSANARIISVVQDLFDVLDRI
jgi:flagellar hook-associated protein 1 FlgK